MRCGDGQDVMLKARLLKTDDEIELMRNACATVDAAFDGVARMLRPGVRECAGTADTNCIASYNMFANDPAKIGLDPKIGSLFKSYPLPNNYKFGDGLNTATYLWNPPTRNEGPHYMVRLDHAFSTNHTVFVRWLQATQDTREGDPLNGRPISVR